MINFIKNKFLSLIQSTHLDDNKTEIRIYNNLVHNSQYALGYAVGVGAALGFCFQSFNFFNAIAVAFVLGIPLSLPGYLIGFPLYRYWQNRNFKMFRKYEYFRKLQDTYFYQEDQVINMLKNKESQYIILALFDNITAYFPQSERIVFQNKIYLLKHLLKDGNWGLAAQEFLLIYPKYLSYANEMKDIEVSAFDLQMLEAQHSLLNSYLNEVEDHSATNSLSQSEDSSSHTDSIYSKGSGNVQYQYEKEKKIDWHRLINHK